MSHRILYDQRCNAVRMTQCKPEAHRAAVVLHVESVPVQSNSRCKLVDHICKMVERVLKFAGIGRIAVSEAWIIRCHQMILRGKLRHQPVVHTGGRWKAMK